MTIKRISFIGLLLLFIPVICLPQMTVNQPIPPSSDSLFTVDSIKVKGNNITEDFVILRELTFKEGDRVSDKILDYNRERVFSLGLFNDVQIIPVKKNNICTIDIVVKESWYIYPIPFVRYKDKESSKSTYGVNLLYKNFRGRDQTIRASLAFGYDPSFSLMYNIPVLFKSRDLGIGFIFNYVNFENKTDEGVLLNNGNYNYKGVQGSVYLNYRLNQFNLLISTLGYNYFEAPHKNFQSITSSPGRIDRFPIAGFDYYYDSRDLKQYAAEGTYFALSIYHKGFGFYDINYNAIETDIRRYVSVNEDVTWKGRFKARTLIGENVPLYDYSLLGYQDYIRGTSRKKFDGKTYVLTSMEMSIPLVREWDMKLKLPLLPESLTSARIGIQFALFADAGSAFDNYTDFNFHNLTYGWGLGINILLLPYNGFRIEYAFDHNMKGEVLIASGFSF